MSRETHHAIATEMEDRAGELLKGVVMVGGFRRSPTPKQVAEAQALSTLALSHRTAAHTEVIQREGRPR
jgi:hypothetical protein